MSFPKFQVRSIKIIVFQRKRGSKIIKFTLFRFKKKKKGSHIKSIEERTLEINQKEPILSKVNFDDFKWSRNFNETCYNSNFTRNNKQLSANLLKVNFIRVRADSSATLPHNKTSNYLSSGKIQNITQINMHNIVL